VSIENGERFLRRLQADAGLQAQVDTVGPDGFEALTAAAGASCTAYELACALARQIGRGAKDGE